VHAENAFPAIVHDRCGDLHTAPPLDPDAWARLPPPAVRHPAHSVAAAAHHVRGMLVRRGLTEFANAPAQRTADLGEPTGAENDDNDDQDNDEFPATVLDVKGVLGSRGCWLG
jgi:hypothetical protein